jgi:hypothetical protein
MPGDRVREGEDCEGTPATNDDTQQAGGAEPGAQDLAARRVAIRAAKTAGPRYGVIQVI